MTSDREQTLKELRDSAIQDSENVAKSQRFALFSSPVPLAVGDNSYSPIKRPESDMRDEQGKVITAPRNIQVSAPKQGMVPKSYFSNLGYTTIGDKYVDPERRVRQQELEKKSLIRAEQTFKPADGYKYKTALPWEYQSDYKEVKKVYRDKDGKVITENKNITTNPACKLLYKDREHMKDDYNRIKELERKEREEHLKKVGERPMFKTTEHGQKTFNPIKQVYGLDKEMKEKKERVFSPKIYKHEVPFKPPQPPKLGYNATFEKYPEHKSDPIKEIVRQDKPKLKDNFKPNHMGNKSGPQNSVQFNVINLRRDFVGSPRY